MFFIYKKMYPYGINFVDWIPAFAGMTIPMLVVSYLLFHRKFLYGYLSAYATAHPHAARWRALKEGRKRAPEIRMK